jgi:hypothetical protein
MNLGACQDCKVGEHGAALFRENMSTILRIILQDSTDRFDTQLYDSLSGVFLEKLNKILIHNLFDIKHLMQHEVSEFFLFCNFLKEGKHPMPLEYYMPTTDLPYLVPFQNLIHSLLKEYWTRVWKATFIYGTHFDTF